jgi:phosphoglycolate phosphatase
VSRNGGRTGSGSGRAERLVIFDFDGTLADSAAWFTGVLNDVARAYGFRVLTKEQIEALRGCDNRTIVRALGVPTWKLPFIARHVRRLAARDADRIRLFAGVEAMLQSLSARGFHLAIVSSNGEDTIRRVLGPETSQLIGTYACGAALFGKARRIRAVLRRTGIGPDRAIAIGDEVRDIEAARRAGIASGAIAWGYATPELLSRHRPTLAFASVEEIADRLGVTDCSGPGGG